MMVEAKSLGTPLQDALEQGLRYCLIKRTRYLSITDGGRWEIYYDTDKTGDPGKKRLVEFDLKDQSATEACLQALALWGLRVSGHVATSLTSLIPPTPPSLNEQKWQPLSKLNPQRGSRPPVEVRFPDGSDVRVKAWKWLLVEVARWLIKNNHLTQSHCPILKTPRSKRYAVSTESVHSDKKQFTSPIRAGSLYIETNTSSRGIAKGCQTVIKHVGQDPAEFKVRFSPPRT